MSVTHWLEPWSSGTETTIHCVVAPDWLSPSGVRDRNRSAWRLVTLYQRYVLRMMGPCLFTLVAPFHVPVDGTWGLCSQRAAHNMPSWVRFLYTDTETNGVVFT